jgi:hypothetical protein
MKVFWYQLVKSGMPEEKSLRQLSTLKSSSNFVKFLGDKVILLFRTLQNLKIKPLMYFRWSIYVRSMLFVVISNIRTVDSVEEPR